MIEVLWAFQSRHPEHGAISPRAGGPPVIKLDSAIGYSRRQGSVIVKPKAGGKPADRRRSGIGSTRPAPRRQRRGIQALERHDRW